MKKHFNINSKFLVSGGLGFIGSNIANHLSELGLKVRILDNYSTGKESNLLHKNNTEIIKGDVQDPSVCQHACEGIDYILHHAAIVSVPYSIINPQTTHNVNVNGTVNMLLAARDQNVKRFIYASSAAVCGNSKVAAENKKNSNHLLSLYAATKEINEIYSSLFYRNYGTPTIGLRYYNIYGEGQNCLPPNTPVIPYFVESLIKNESPFIFGDGKQSRDFTHVSDVVLANLKACIAPESAFGQVFDIASGKSLTLENAYQIICKILKKNIVPTYLPERQGDVRYSRASIQLSQEILKYYPQTMFEKGIEKLVDWHKKCI